MNQTISQEYGGALIKEQKSREAINSNLRVAIPGIIQSFDPQEQTASVQPAIREVIYDQNGTPTHLALPELLDVPITMPHAGDYAITLPIQVGDECLVIFADMCIDAWWQSGDVQNQIELRRHDLSDAFAILGPWSQPKRLTNYNSKALQIYNTKSGTGIEIDAQGVKLTGNLEITGNISIEGNSELKGAVLGKLTAQGVDLVSHYHEGTHGPTGGPQ